MKKTKYKIAKENLLTTDERSTIKEQLTIFTTPNSKSKITHISNIKKNIERNKYRDESFDYRNYIKK